MTSPDPVPVLKYGLSRRSAGAADPDLVDIDAIIKFIRNSWRLWIIWIAAGVGVSLCVLALGPGKYTAAAVILFDSSITRAAPASASAADVTSAYVDTQVLVLGSDEVLGRVVDRLQPLRVRGFGTAGAISEREARRGAILRLAEALSVRRIGISNAIEVLFTSEQRVRSAEIVNTVIQSYIDGQHELRRQAASAWLADLRERLAELRKKAFGMEPERAATPTESSGETARLRFREGQDSTEAYRSMYNSLLQRANADVSPENLSISARVVTPAEPPLNRTQPKLMLIGILIGSLVGGFAHALLRAVIVKSVRDAADFEGLDRIDRVTVLPDVPSHLWFTEKGEADALQRAYVTASPGICGALTGLAFWLRDRHLDNAVIAVTSPSQGVGASSIAAHLATIFAESGRKTLLVDADWKKGAALAEPEPPMKAGGNRMLAAGLTSIHFEPGRFDVLALRAMAPISPVNASLSVLSALQNRRGGHECIIADLHSMLQTPDLQACLPEIDCVIVVVESRRTMMEHFFQVINMLPHEKTTAVIVNKVRPGPPSVLEELTGLISPLIHCSRSVMIFPPVFSDIMRWIKRKERGHKSSTQLGSRSVP